MLGHLTSSPLGAYTCGDSSHLHGATTIGGQWTGSYDASGNLTYPRDCALNARATSRWASRSLIASRLS
jgi:hypothetical protein